MAERWLDAKLGPAHTDELGRRWCVVHVECDGDPRVEVMELLGSEKPKRKHAKALHDE
jgi:hypothetical protein